ncbi:MAG: NifB/NifX family molybdenum-iron cluster-binding protein [Vampirovibrionia bacterium]
MKKIAVALSDDKNTVSAHFGTCAAYMLYEAEGDQVVSKKEVVNELQSHQGGCAVPGFINSLGANVVITGGMGVKAIEKCAGYGIEVVMGHVGPVEEIVEGYLKGEIVSVGDGCDHHSC